MMFERARSRRAYRLDADEAFPGDYEHDPLGGGFDEPGGRFGESYGVLDESYGDRDESNGDRDESDGDRQDGYNARREPAGQAGASSHVLARGGRCSVLMRRRAGVAVVALVAMAFSALVVHALRAGLAGSEPASGPSRAMPRTAPVTAGRVADAPSPRRHGRRRLAAGAVHGIPRIAHRVFPRQSPPRARGARAVAVAVPASPTAGGGIPPYGPSRMPEFGFER